MKLFQRIIFYRPKIKLINRFRSCVSRRTIESENFLAINNFSYSVSGNGKTLKPHGALPGQYKYSALSYSWKTHFEISHLKL